MCPPPSSVYWCIKRIDFGLFMSKETLAALEAVRACQDKISGIIRLRPKRVLCVWCFSFRVLCTSTEESKRITAGTDFAHCG